MKKEQAAALLRDLQALSKRFMEQSRHSRYGWEFDEKLDPLGPDLECCFRGFNRLETDLTMLGNMILAIEIEQRRKSVS